MKTVGSPKTLQSTAGKPTAGRAVPLQEIAVTEEHMRATRLVTGDVPTPSADMSPALIHVPATPLVLGTEAPSSATSAAIDNDGLVQPHHVGTAERTPGTEPTVVLSDVQRSTGTSPHSLTWIPAELHTAAVRQSQEVTAGLDEATSPLVTAASITAGNTEPAPTTSDRVTSPTVPATTGSLHHVGIQKSGTMIPPGTASATITSPADDVVSEATAPGLAAPGISGDGLHRDAAVTHPRVTSQLHASTASAPGTSGTAMDVSTAPHVPTIPYAALGSAETESTTAEATTDTAVLPTEGTLMGLDVGMISSVVAAVSLPDGVPGGGYSSRTSAVTGTPAAHPSGATFGGAAGTVTAGFGSDPYGPGTATLSPAPHAPAGEGTGSSVPLGSSTTPMKSEGEHSALQSTTAGKPTPGRVVPLQEITATEEHMLGTRLVTGNVPKTSADLSPAVIHAPATPLVLLTEAPSSATSTATGNDGLVQPHRVGTAERTLGTEPTVVLSDVQRSTGTSPHSLTWIPAELHKAAVHLSQEVTAGLDEATSPLVTAASITAGNTEPAPTTPDRVTSPTVPATTGSPHRVGIQKSGTMIPPGTASATITPPAIDVVSEASAPGTSGDGLHRDAAVTHPRVTSQLHASTAAAPGTSGTAMDVSTAPLVPTIPYAALGSAETESTTAEATTDTAVLPTEGTLMGLDVGMISSVVADVLLPDGVPGGGYSSRTSAVTGTPAAHPSGTTFGGAAGTVTTGFGSDPYGPGTATLSPAPHAPTEKGTGSSVPLGSSSAPMKTVGSPKALQSTAGKPTPGRAVPLQEITATEEHMRATRLVTGDIPMPSADLSPAVIHVPATPLVLGTEAPSSATSTAIDNDGLVQPHRVGTAERTPGTEPTVVLSDVQRSTGTSPHSLTRTPAELHTAAVRQSQEVTAGLDEATSPLVTAASITAGNTEPAPTTPDRVTSPTVQATTGSPHRVGIQKSGTVIPPGTASATITPPADDVVSEATAPGLAAPGTSGDGLHRDAAVTHPRVTSQLHASTAAAPGTSGTAMDVSTAPHVPTIPYAALGSAETESTTAEATTDTAVLPTEGTLTGLDVGTVSSVVAAVSLPDGVPGGGYSSRTSAVTDASAIHPASSTSGWVGITVTPSFGSDSYEPAMGTLSASPLVPMEKWTSASVSLSSSTAPTMSVGSPGALQSTTGQPAPGTSVPLQEGITDKEHVSDSSMLTGDVPAPSDSLSPPATLAPATPLVLLTEAPSSATSTAIDNDGLVQPHRVGTTERTLGTEPTVVLSDVQRSTGTSPHSLTWIPAELHTAAVHQSQEVTTGLDEATSPLVTAASITAGNTEPAPTTPDCVTSPTVPATTASLHHVGTQKSGTMIPPGTASATITPPAIDVVIEATAPGTSGDGLHRDAAVTHPRVTSQLHASTAAAPGTSGTAMDVSTAPRVPTIPYAALGSAVTQSTTAEATTDTAVLPTEGTLTGLDVGMVSSVVADVLLPDGVPGGGYSSRTSAVTGTPAAHPGGTTFGRAAGTVTTGFGSNPYGPGTDTLSPVPRAPTEKGTSTSVPLGSSTTPMMSEGEHSALQSTAGKPTAGRAVPLQEITVTKEHMRATRLVTGDVPMPSADLSPAVIHAPATPLVLGTEAPSSATSTATGNDGLVQPHHGDTAKWTLGTEQTVVLSDVQRSTGTSPHSLTWIPAELHTAAVRQSQEVTAGLDEATSPLVTAASITAGNTEPAPTTPDRVTSPTVPATTASPHHVGIQKSGTMIPSGTDSATITPPAIDVVSEATAPGLAAPGTSGDGLHRDAAVTHPRVTSQLHASTAAAPGTSGTAMDVSTAPHVPTTPYAALGSAETESITAEAITGTAVLPTEGTLMGLDVGTVSSVVADVSLPDGVPGGGYSSRTSAVTDASAIHPASSTSGWVAVTVTPSFGSDSYEPAMGTLSASPLVPMEKWTSASVPLSSSTAPTMSVGSPGALQSTTGQPAPGTSVPLQEGITDKEHVSDSSMLTGDVPAPSDSLSPPVTLAPATPLVLLTEAPSSATSTAIDNDGLVQPHRVGTTERTLGTEPTVVLFDVQRSTGTSPHSLTWIPAELHTAAVHQSQEVTAGLDEATSPLVTAASITAGNTEPAPTTPDRVTSPTLPATTGSLHHVGIQKSGTMIPPGTASATITSPADDVVSEATAPGLPAPGTSGDGLHRDAAVTHPRVTSQLHASTAAAPGTSGTAMDVSTAPRVPTTPYAALGSAETESTTAEAITGTAVLPTAGTLMGLDVGTVSSVVADVSLPDGVPGGGYSSRTSAVTGTPAIHPASSTSGWVAVTVTPSFGSDSYEPAMGTLSASPLVPMEKWTSASVSLSSSTAPTMSVGSPGALQSTTGQPAPGTSVPLQEGITDKEHVSDSSMLTGDVPAPSDSLSPPATLAPATPLVLGTEAPSSATSTATGNDLLVQPHRVGTTEKTLGTEQTVVLSDVQRSTGTSPHSLTWTPAELHTAAVRQSQEVTAGLDEATSPLVTAASITAGNTEPAPTTPDRVTSPTVPATTASLHHVGIQKSGTMIPPGTASATITSPADDVVSEATAPGLPAPGTSGDGLHRDAAVTHPRVTSQLHASTAAAPGTSGTAMDVSTAPHVPTIPYAALGSAETESTTAEATTGTAVLPTEGTSMRLSVGTVPSTVPAVASSSGSTVGQMVRSVALGLGSHPQALTGSIPVENPTVGVLIPTANTTSTSAVSALPAPYPFSASTTTQLGTAKPNRSHSAAQVTGDMNTSSATTPMARGAEPGVRRATPVSPSAVGSQRPPTSLASVTAPSPALSRSTAEPDVSVSPFVFQNSSLAVVASSATPTVVASITPSASLTGPAVVAPSVTPSVSASGPAVGTRDTSLGMVTTPSSAVSSSSLGPHSPHVTPETPIKATSSSRDPALEDSSTDTWEATGMSWKNTIPASNAITPAGSPSIDTSMVTRHTTVSPPMATANSGAQSPSAMHDVPTALRVTNHKATSASTAMSSPAKGIPAASSPTRAAPGLGAQSGPIIAPGASTYATPQNPVSKPGTELVPAVSLYPFGAAEGDTECIQRTVDFNSPLLEPEIGFPLGKALRDTLYFTDNGQIIFPPTDNHVPSSPHPPSQGFSGHEALPVVAAFWDDADFSRGVGTTWYQEYPTLGSIRDPIIHDVEAKIQKYMRVPYSAKWTLKVTWEKAPSYPSQLDDAQTNTYQAVLSTDGSRSFALLLYQDGGMQWDYAGLAARDALIGFSRCCVLLCPISSFTLQGKPTKLPSPNWKPLPTVYWVQEHNPNLTLTLTPELLSLPSGDGYAQNSELTEEPPAVRYRPDQHRSSGTDVRGLWLFRLDNRSRVNYRLQCLTWLQAQPSPSTWSMELPPCPCSRPQAELDPRYRRSRSAESPPAPGVTTVPQNTSDLSVMVLRTTSPSRMGAGVRCVYRGAGFLEGWQERFWSPPNNLSDNQELEAFEWCCRQVGKPHFCTRYSEKRPRAGCEGYVPPTPANAFGDPHVTTLDGLTYTFNALGDFMLLLASDAHTSFVLQGRMARTSTARASNFMAFVAQYTSSTTTTVEWTLGSSNEVQVLLNYETIQFSYSQGKGDMLLNVNCIQGGSEVYPSHRDLASEVGNAPLSEFRDIISDLRLVWAPSVSSFADMDAEVYYSPGVLLVNTSSITAIFDGTISISVSANSGMLNAVCSLLEQYHNGTRGLLGVWNHNPADDFQMPNGTNIPVNSSEEDIFSYGMTWAVGEHSLFAQPLAAPVTAFNPIFLSQLRQENKTQYQLAASQCHGCRECIYDMLSTGDVALGLATQSLVEDYQKRKAALGKWGVGNWKSPAPSLGLYEAREMPPNATKVLNCMAQLAGTQAWEMPPRRDFVGWPWLRLPRATSSLRGTLTKRCQELLVSTQGCSSLRFLPSCHHWQPIAHSIQDRTSHQAVPSYGAGSTLCPSHLIRAQHIGCRSIQQCDYSSTTTIASSSLQLAACRCDDGYWGPFCQHAPDPCAQGCFPGVGCDPHTGCGPCPPGLTGDGQHCADIDECVQKTACQGNLTCTNTVGSYTCSCPADAAGEGLGCGTACRSHSCPEGFCSNGGRCHLHPPSCTPTCECPPAFTDRHCVVAGGDFPPLASADLPQRSVLLWVRATQSATAEEVNATVSAILGSLEVKAFWSNTNITCMTADGLTFAVVAKFTYNSSSFVIQFLNEELTVAVTNAFNGQRARRELAHFAHLHLDNITDLVKLSVPELQHYFSCSLYGYEGYQLDYVGTSGLICISPCKKGYCQHGGHCQHLPEGPTCSCVPFSIFSPGGAHCEQLAVSLAAFISIMVGALALLCLLLSTACLAAQLCRRHREPRRTKGTFWRERPFTSLMKAEEGAEASGRLWEPQLQAIDPSIQMRFKRPHILPPCQGTVQP
ncbi:mucin-4 [Lagopus muta]|uniref:mucin-4 n=1 Tax=Lagopus muta TaxID=64668 RepID=UPI00209DF4A6|nr:mucin-4 [Lagopus muta]